ncbi:family 43 glycosylhydrolase [Streptomyces sp. LBUM 1486]|uniref:family 43 glycosylhydrolase n=1 Tax=Streptomyces scabiei TaxID=1930 RepID=UPI001BB5E2BD|nr:MULTISPECIES: family 43 glycosylhydrolase [Streptomyces]MBP5872387.1 family 43 glycosylhydrolase [Streptomyces sp. LBUM 1485]MBP5911439.1 family 43 glycosylhydrolase [Streptomyces sp. LBUM 1486]MDX3028408.1 family 43 glycosylhydrolase [Streptomyces scabiei]MDX3205057.1 family 43 glycosylhydrolase [Streptomyces scabiei]QTU52026.1 family 43 glycosylhydrolase [Streptomyces sp. LBUM 1480]
MTRHDTAPPRPGIRGRARRPALASILVALLTLLGLVTAGPAQALSGDLRMHDPSLIKVGSCYYGFSTGFENDPLNPSGSITVRKTCAGTAASGWTKVGNVWSSTPSWITAKLGSTPPNIWAPDVKYFNGKYHLYYAGSLWGSAYAVMGLATATDIEGPWTDQGMVTDVNYPIDPNVDWGPDGRLYITWGSFTGPGTYMHVLDEATGKLSTTDNNLWHLAVGIENPTIILNGGYYYLFGSKGLCCSGTNSNYYTVVGRSTSITGPYLDQSGVNMLSNGGTTVLTGARPKVAAGGADAYDDGASKFLAYHYYDADNAGRETLDIRQVTFANGWPVLAGPLGAANNHLLNRNADKCADVWFASTADEASVNSGNCNSGTNQQWVSTAVGSDYRLVNVNSGKCLQIAGAATANGAAAVQSTCTGASHQLWKKTAVIGGYVTYTNVNSGKCLQVAGASTANGAALEQSTCNAGANQQWMVV